jgi:hypothetical protein
MRAPTPYDCRAEPTRAVPQATAAPVASRERMNSSLVFAVLARWYVWPKTGVSTASSTVWLKMVPRAIAEGLTAGRSVRWLVLAW